MSGLLVDGRFKVNGLPEHIRREIDQFLIDGNFRGYSELHARVNELLAAEDLELAIARSSLARYGARLRQAVLRLREQVFVLRELRRVWDEEADQPAAGAEMGLRLVLSELIARSAHDPEELSVKELVELGRAIAELQSLLGTDLTETTKKSGGLRAETLRTIDATILGLGGSQNE